MLNRSASLAMSTCVLKALLGKLDIKRHSPSILYFLCSLDQRESNRNVISMVIIENIRNHRKVAEKLRGYTYTIANISAVNCQRASNVVLT